MGIIRPITFYREYLRVTQDKQDGLVKNWENYRKYTHIMKHKILPTIQKELELEGDEEYYSIDYVFFEREDHDNFPKSWKSYWAESISVAIEHENDCSTIQKEINKLALFAIPLKVVITYPENQENIKELLTMGSDIIKKSDLLGVHGSTEDTVNFLMIFGLLVDNAIEWSAYLLNNDGSKYEFIRIEDLFDME